METLKDFLWPIVAIGELGAVVDFSIGRTGQERATNFLLKWWVRFGDAHPTVIRFVFIGLFLLRPLVINAIPVNYRF